MTRDLILVLAFAAPLAAQGGAPAPLPRLAVPYPVVANIWFAEGPVFDARGNLYICNYLRSGTIGRMSPDGSVAVWCETGGAVNGLKIDGAGHLVGTDILGKRVIRIDPETRRIEVLTDGFEGKPYLNPNDLALDRAGNIYFTDPSHEVASSVYRIDPSRRVTRVAGGLRYPNGIAVAPDQTQLLVAETDRSRIVSVPLTPAGSGGPARQVFQFATPTVDGIAFDEYGRLWVARWVNGTLDVITLDGKLVAQVDAGGTRVTNLCFRDRSVYASVAGRNAIHRLDVGIGGAR